MKKYVTVSIDKLIEKLIKEKEEGATEVSLHGEATVITNNSNTVILTTEIQW